MGARALFGRRVIYTDVAEINAGNIIDVLQKALFVHLQNSADIDYLYRYYRGDQPVLYREKEVRPEICNKVVENRANEIVSFKVGYLMGEPVQYVSRNDDENISAEVSRLDECFSLISVKLTRNSCSSLSISLRLLSSAASILPLTALPFSAAALYL